MNKKKKNVAAVRAKCFEALERIDQAILNHEKSVPEGLTISILEQIKAEVETMAATLDSDVYQPYYPRFLLDLPDESDINHYLFGVAHFYKSHS